MSELLETIHYKGYPIKIYLDDHAESPDEWGNDERFLVFDHRDICVKREGFNPTDIFDDNEKVEGYHVFRCYAYIHGGIALAVESHSFPDSRWDVSFKGFWLIKRMKGTWRREHALEAARRLCKTWNKYLAGEVYGYRGPEESCWGFYDKEQMILEAKDEIDYMIREKNKKHFHKLKAYIKHHVPLQSRRSLSLTLQTI